ncbi:fucolectin [Bombina bombina]|uniref:fucolectin n=1 Tax=Bombina bombina TaxID=8345 RepID=UPI00235AC294|nr:fucolectin [Bombina bombina]
MFFLLAISFLLIVPYGASQGSYSYCEGDCKTSCQYENVALRGRATQSSVFGNTKYGYVSWPINAIDGNPDADYYHGSCTHTNNDMSPWWRLDLLRNHRISKVIITNRGDCCGERLNGGEILIGSSLANNGNNNPRCAQITNSVVPLTQSFDCDNLVGRYVNIVIPGRQDFLHFCEVAVYGVPTHDDNFCESSVTTQ